MIYLVFCQALVKAIYDQALTSDIAAAGIPGHRVVPALKSTSEPVKLGMPDGGSALYRSPGNHYHHHCLEGFTTKAIFVNPPANSASTMMAEQLVHHREAVRQVAANHPKGYLVGVRDGGRPGQLAERLDPDDPC